jgi:hypothetical protein
MNDKKLYKVVFTLSSGKSIVYTMNSDNANQAFTEWKLSKESGEDSNKILEITKVKDGDIFEKFGVDRTKIDAIQIEDQVITDKIYNDNKR